MLKLMFVGSLPDAEIASPPGKGPMSANNWLIFAGSSTVPSPSALLFTKEPPGSDKKDTSPVTVCPAVTTESRAAVPAASTNNQGSAEFSAASTVVAAGVG